MMIVMMVVMMVATLLVLTQRSDEFEEVTHGSVPRLAHVAAAISPSQLVRAAARLYIKIPWKPSCKIIEHGTSSSLQSNSVDHLETIWLEMETISRRPIQRRNFQMKCSSVKVLVEWKSLK